jgi:hypothetical protein
MWRAIAGMDSRNLKAAQHRHEPDALRYRSARGLCRPLDSFIAQLPDDSGLGMRPRPLRTRAGHPQGFDETMKAIVQDRML